MNIIFVKTTKKSDEDILTECLDVLADLSARFANAMLTHAPIILRLIVPHLKSGKQNNAKKTIACMESIALFIPPTLFDSTVSGLISEMEKNPKRKSMYIQALSTLAKRAGSRLSKHVEQISPQLLEVIESKGESKEDINLKESAIQCLRSLLSSCRNSVEPNFDKIVNLALELIKFDPNYADDEEGEEDEEEGEEDDDDGDDDDYEQDEMIDDNTWQVRKASAKILRTVIVTTPARTKELCEKIGPAILKRFSEREESVRLEVVNVFRSIISQLKSFKLQSLLKEWTDSVVSQISKQFKSIQKIKNVSVRVSLFQCLREMSSSVAGIFSDHLAQISPGINEAIKDKKNMNVQQESLQLAVKILETHSPQATQPFLSQFTNSDISALSSTNPQVAAAANVLASKIVVLSTEKDLDIVKQLLKAITPSFEATDLDISVKEAAIAAVAQILSKFGAKIEDSEKLLRVLIDRLKNEVTRNAAIIAIEMISNTTPPLNISSLVSPFISELTVCLRQANRQTKTASLSALNALINAYGSKSTTFTSQSKQVIEQSSKLIIETDLYLCQLAISVCTSSLKADPSCIESIKISLFPAVQSLTQSSLIEGAALEALVELYHEITKVNSKGFGFTELYDTLIKMSKSEQVQKENSYTGISSCIASITLASDSSTKEKTIQSLLSNVKSANSEIIVSLYSLGEIGKREDLSSLGDELYNVISKALASKSEEITNSASFAFGGVAVGSLSKFLPILLKEVSKEQEKQYAVLNSLKLVISLKSVVSEAIKEIESQLDNILSILFRIKMERTLVKNIIAECLGRLVSVNPEKVISELESKLKSDNSLMRSCVVSALKFVRFEEHNELADKLKFKISSFLATLADKELVVRSAALSSLNYVASRAPSVVQQKDALNKTLLSQFYNQTVVKPELVRTIDLGPIKHKVDDGLELRKLAFQCIVTFLDHCPNVIEPQDVLQLLPSGLADDEEVKLLCYMILVRMTKIAGPLVLENLPKVLEVLLSDLSKKELSSNIRRVNIQTFAALTLLPNWNAASNKFLDAVKQLEKGEFADQYNQAKQDLQN